MNQTYLISEDFFEYHVLLLEDDRELAEMLTEFLQSRHCLVTTALNGVQGIQRVLAADFHFIICDLVMPGFPGDKFYIAVERVKPHLCPRFIFMTGHQADPGIDAFIRQIQGILLWKPFPLHDLLTAMKMANQRSIEQLIGAGATQEQRARTA